MPLKIKRPSLALLPFAASAVMLSVIQAPTNGSFFAWVAMVPFAWACAPTARTRSVFLAAYVVGSLYWLVNLYWLAWITAAGWITMGLYIGLLWPLLALAVRFCRKKGVPLFLALPVLVVGAEQLQGFPLGGFYWRLLGHSQYQHLTFIQIADVFGAGGVSFLVAMVNGAIADLVVKARRVCIAHQFDSTAGGKVCDAHPTRIIIGTVATVLAIAGTIGYGRWRIAQTAEVISEGPRVAALQSNVPQSVKGSGEASRDIFDELMASNQAAQGAGAELIVWPETMVQAIIEPGLWARISEWDWSDDKAFDQALREAAAGQSYILVGAHGGRILADPQGELYLGQYNSAYFYRPDGTLDPDRYDKIHLVLFGEYIPFRRSFNWLYQQLKRFAPPEYSGDYSLEHGTHYTVFEMNPPIGGQRTEDEGQRTEGGEAASNPRAEPGSQHHFAVIICYEDAIPYVARNFALDENGQKRIDWLVNISNDGWFVNHGNGWLAGLLPSGPSTELAQHAAICTFRAVENRLAVVRSVNTGISCLIDSTGRIRDGYLAASEGFPAEAMGRTGMAGWFLDEMPIDSRVTFYSRHGQWLDTSCAVAFVALLAAPVVVRVARRKGGQARQKASRR